MTKPDPAAARPAMASTLATMLLASLALPLTLLGIGPEHAYAAGAGSQWTEAEKTVLASMSIDRLPSPPADPSNAVETRTDAAALGKRLFSDARLSANGQVSCASCHAPERQFQDGLPVGQGVGTGSRRTMPVAATAHSPWLFWDGRKDSLWSQALGPLEDSVEHGATRVQLVRALQTNHRAEYEAVFGAMPSLQGLPAEAGPLGSPRARQAWAGISDAQRDGVNRAFANLGKAIAAYERTLTYGPARFDRYVAAVLENDRAGQAALSAEEVNGLRHFIGKAQCSTCHNGPLFTDQHFHNTGVPQRDAGRPDRGRKAATAKVQADEFNCLGRYSDAPASACQELRFMATDGPELDAAFKTPSLRNVALRAPYMHAGQFDTLEAVVSHYVRSPAAAVGHSELGRQGHQHAERAPIRLSAQEEKELVAFLRALSGPVLERAAP